MRTGWFVALTLGVLLGIAIDKSAAKLREGYRK